MKPSPSIGIFSLKIDMRFFILYYAGGHAKTLMFVQINPDIGSYSETSSTLKFAERVSGVELGAAKSQKEGKDIRDLMEQVLCASHFIFFVFQFYDNLMIHSIPVHYIHTFCLLHSLTNATIN